MDEQRKWEIIAELHIPFLWADRDDRTAREALADFEKVYVLLSTVNEALRTAQSQLAQERERVKVLEGVIRKTIDDVEFLTCVDDVSDAVQRVTVKRMREALSAADEQVSSGDGNSNE